MTDKKTKLARVAEAVRRMESASDHLSEALDDMLRTGYVNSPWANDAHKDMANANVALRSAINDIKSEPLPFYIERSKDQL